MLDACRAVIEPISSQRRLLAAGSLAAAVPAAWRSMSTDQKRLRIQVRDVLAAAGSRAPGPGARFDELEVLKANALTWAHYVDANEADHDAADKYKALLELARIAQNVWAQVGWAK